MVFATALNLVGFFINCAAILMTNRVSDLLAGSSRIQKLSQYVLGTVFAGLAVRLAIDNQR